jgi:hypothetical protein
MGQAKTKMQLKQERRVARAARLKYLWTVPERTFKGLVAVLLLPVLLPIMFFGECFRRNEFPWQQ